MTSPPSRSSGSRPIGPVPRGEVTVTVTDEKGQAKPFTATVRIDTPEELVAFWHGGILPYVLRQLVGVILTRTVKAKALELGFDGAVSHRLPIPRTCVLPRLARRGYAGTMGYLTQAQICATVRRIRPRPLGHRDRARSTTPIARIRSIARPARAVVARMPGATTTTGDRASAAGRIARLDARGRVQSRSSRVLCRHRANPGARLRAVMRASGGSARTPADRPRAGLVALSRLSHLQPAARTGRG